MQFTGSVQALPRSVIERMTGRSWRVDCPVPMDELAYLQLSHRDFDGVAKAGELVIAARVAKDVLGVFQRLFEAGFPIAQMRLVDDFDADDELSMAANNTSGFNGRRVAGTDRWSEHAFGLAIDVNPVQNPYLHDGRISPPASAAYLDRGHERPGMALPGGVLVAAFADIGWGWGGTWPGRPDYHHFSASGR